MIDKGYIFANMKMPVKSFLRKNSKSPARRTTVLPRGLSDAGSEAVCKPGSLASGRGWSARHKHGSIRAVPTLTMLWGR